MTDSDAYYEMHRDIIKDEAAEDDPHSQGITITPYGEFIIVGAVRYARGRATYIVGMTVDWVINHWDELSENTRHNIARDVAEECEYRDNTPRSVLSEIDDPDWQRLWNHIKENTND